MACIQFAAKLQQNVTNNSVTDNEIDEKITKMIDSIDNII